MRFEPTTLEGEFVRLEPLSKEHKHGLCEAISDGELWNLQVTLVPHPDQIDGFFEKAAEIREAGAGLAFATFEKKTGRIAGSTRFMHANLKNKRTEIGFTFLGKSWQRTPVNTEAKLLMLNHAFETMEMNRVEFLTDFENTVSRRAIARIGAKEEGILRNHMIMRAGRLRHSVVFSIIKDEWPSIKDRLQQKLRRHH